MKFSQILVSAGLAVATLLGQGIPDFTPATPLIGAVMRHDTAEAKRLLEAGANPNEGRLIGMTPLHLAVIRRDAALVEAMVAKSADVKAVDGAGSTVLMWAAADEQARTDLVREFLRLGVDVNAKNLKGETALEWASRRGDTPVVEMLRQAGANGTNRAKSAVENAIAVLQKSGPQFTKVSGCASCHHQSLPQMAIGIARQKGVAVNEAASQQQVKAVMAMYRPARELMAKGTDMIPDTPITVSYGLLGLHAEGYGADETTAAMAHVIAAKQQPDGRFPSFPARPPMESSDITATALSVRAIQLYGENPAPAVAKAREWLQAAKPATSEERAMRLMGLKWAGADAAVLQAAAKSVLAEQRADGGWAQLGGLTSDAYATGQTLVALAQSGQVATAEQAYQMGMAFLLRTQAADGSWLVRTRAFPVQPYKESGFPYGKDQWISAAGTSWAAMAIGLALPEPAAAVETSAP